MPEKSSQKREKTKIKLFIKAIENKWFINYVYSKTLRGNKMLSVVIMTSQRLKRGTTLWFLHVFLFVSVSLCNCQMRT